MPPTRSPQFTAAIDWLRDIATAVDPGSLLTVASLRQQARSEAIDLGAADNYLLRGLREIAAEGLLRQTQPGAYVVPEPAPAAPAPAPAPAPADINSTRTEPELAEEPEIPAQDTGFRMPATVAPYIADAAAAIASGETRRILAVGPAGCGKTEAGLQAAAHANAPAIVVDVSLIREPRDLFGSRTYDGTRIGWRDSAFTAAVERGRCVVILDELNRASAEVLNALLPLLDRRGAARIDERGRAVRVGHGVVWWATANEGTEYVGASMIDRALADRFSRRVEFNYPTPSIEAEIVSARVTLPIETIERLCKISAMTRRSDCRLQPLSVRQVIAAAEDLQRIGEESMQATILAHYDCSGGTESDRALAASMLVAHGFNASQEDSR
jgi:MoxR-like ATPase